MKLTSTSAVYLCLQLTVGTHTGEVLKLTSISHLCLCQAERSGEFGPLGQGEILGALEAAVELLQLQTRVDGARFSHLLLATQLQLMRLLANSKFPTAAISCTQLRHTCIVIDWLAGQRYVIGLLKL